MKSADTLRLRGRKLAIAVAIALLALLAFGAWAFASPVGASPDDDFHLASAWCGLGERDEICELTENPRSREVPAQVAAAAHCFAFNSEQSAACQIPDAGQGDVGMAATDRGNFTGQYPGLYYSVMSVLASTNVDVSVLLMRFLNAALFIGFSIALYVFLPVARRATLAWAWLISLVPLGMFIIPSNNPSSWAVISAGSMWIALVGYLETTGRRRAALGVIAALSAAIGIGSRPDAALFTVIGVAVAVLMTARWARDYILPALLPLAIVLASVAVVLAGNPGALASAGLGPSAQEPLENSVALVLGNLLNVPLLWAGAFGSWNLGWLDTQMPGVVSVGVFACFAAVAFAGLRLVSWRKLSALGLVGVALWAIPTYVLVQNRVIVGAEVQPRYLLPLLVILAGLALATVGSDLFRLGRLQRYLVVAVLVGANAVALQINIRRYITGTDVMAINLDDQVEWWWSAAPSPMVVWIVGSIAFGLLVALVVRELGRTARHERLAELAPLAIQ